MGPIKKRLDYNPKNGKTAQVKYHTPFFLVLSFFTVYFCHKLCLESAFTNGHLQQPTVKPRSWELFWGGSQKLTVKPQSEKCLFETQHQLKHSLLFVPSLALCLCCTKMNFHGTMGGTNFKTGKNKQKRTASILNWFPMSFAMYPYWTFVGTTELTTRECKAIVEGEMFLKLHLKESKALVSGLLRSTFQWETPVN